LQIILPVLLIFLTYYGIKSEQEQGRIKLLIIQGVSFRQMIAGKVIAVWLLSQLVLTITIAAQWLSFGLLPSGDLLLRSGLLFLAYFAFYGIITSVTALLSITFLKGASALTGMLAIWVLWLVFIPKFSSWWVEENTPLPSRQEFKEAMREDRSKGIDGHNPSGDREKELRDSVLLAYGVSTLDSLPINYDGIRMQADEEYGNKVWDKHFGALFEEMRDQKARLQRFGLINPFMTLQSLSMGISGTDQWSHLHFQKAAESYRRVFIKELNDEHAYGGSKSGDWGWKAEQTFFNEIDDFQYELPVFSQAGSTYQIDWIILFSWLVLSLLGLFLFSNKINFVSL
jgi:ABC-2 type transport system permease protein